MLCYVMFINNKLHTIYRLPNKWCKIQCYLPLIRPISKGKCVCLLLFAVVVCFFAFFSFLKLLLLSGFLTLKP